MTEGEFFEELYRLMDQFFSPDLLDVVLQFSEDDFGSVFDVILFAFDVGLSLFIVGYDNTMTYPIVVLHALYDSML